MKVGGSTPWGRAQTVQQVAEGIWSVTTAGHGGIRLSPERNKQVHSVWRIADRWYEEDCDWAIVALTFPEHFEKHQEAATQSAKNWRPAMYTAVTGNPVELSESHMLRKETFEKETRDKFVVRSAFIGTGHFGTVPLGFIGVVAVRASTQEQKHFLVPEAEYEKRVFGQGFVVDEARHQPWTTYA